MNHPPFSTLNIRPNERECTGYVVIKLISCFGGGRGAKNTETHLPTHLSSKETKKASLALKHPQLPPQQCADFFPSPWVAVEHSKLKLVDDPGSVSPPLHDIKFDPGTWVVHISFRSL